MAAGRGLCLNDRGGVFSPYQVIFFGPSFEPVGKTPHPGIISRARVSPDGRYGAATSFVTGDDYAPGAFSTRTTLNDMDAHYAITDLEEFETFRDDEKVYAPDFNFWGVTFVGRGTGLFYATLGTAGHTYLVKGDIATLRLDILRDGVECPSISPDGTRIAFKQRTNPGAAVPEGRAAVLDLATLEDHPLPGTHSIDDQIEWLDNTTVIYAVATRESAPDTWATKADGTGAPTLFLENADSPSVARP